MPTLQYVSCIQDEEDSLANMNKYCIKNNYEIITKLIIYDQAEIIKTNKMKCYAN